MVQVQIEWVAGARTKTKAQEIYANKNNLAQKIGNKKHFLCKAGSNQTHGDFPRRGEDMPSEIRRLQRRATRAEYWWWVLAMEDYEEYHDDDDGDDDEE